PSAAEAERPWAPGARVGDPEGVHRLPPPAAGVRSVHWRSGPDPARRAGRRRQAPSPCPETGVDSAGSWAGRRHRTSLEGVASWTCEFSIVFGVSGGALQILVARKVLRFCLRCTISRG